MCGGGGRGGAKGMLPLPLSNYWGPAPWLHLPTPMFLFFTRHFITFQSRNISLYLINGSGIPDVLTDAVEFFTIRCQQIPATGVMRWVTDESWVTNL